MTCRLPSSAFPGVYDPKTGAVLMAPNIVGIDQFDLAAAVHKRLGIEVFVENDVNLAALGEHWLGNRREHDNFVYISVGTGIGAGVVVGGKLLRGTIGAAGEIGFLPFGADPFEAESLKVGALERVTATSAIVGSYLELSGRESDVPGVFDAAGAGDVAAQETLDRVARQIARAAAAIAAIVDPSLIVVGGSIGTRTELLERIVRFCLPVLSGQDHHRTIETGHPRRTCRRRVDCPVTSARFHICRGTKGRGNPDSAARD